MLGVAALQHAPSLRSATTATSTPAFHATEESIPTEVVIERVMLPQKKMNPLRNSSYAIKSVLSWDQEDKHNIGDVDYHINKQRTVYVNGPYSARQDSNSNIIQHSQHAAQFVQQDYQNNQNNYQFQNYHPHNSFPQQQQQLVTTNYSPQSQYVHQPLQHFQPNPGHAWTQLQSDVASSHIQARQASQYEHAAAQKGRISPPLSFEESLSYTHTGSYAAEKPRVQRQTNSRNDEDVQEASQAARAAQENEEKEEIQTRAEYSTKGFHEVDQEDEYGDDRHEIPEISQHQGKQDGKGRNSRPTKAKAVARAHDSRRTQAEADEDRVERSITQHLARSGAANPLDLVNDSVAIASGKKTKMGLKRYTDAELAELERADPLLYLKVKKLLELHEVALTTRDVRENQERLTQRADERRRRLKAAQLLREIKQRKRAERALASASKKSGAGAGSSSAIVAARSGDGALVLSESSRHMPDSLVARQLQRPPFHNFGVGGMKNPTYKNGVAHLLTHNVTPELPPNKSPARQVYTTARRAWRERVRSAIEDDRCLQQMLEPALMKANASIVSERQQREIAKLAKAVRVDAKKFAKISEAKSVNQKKKHLSQGGIGVSDPDSHFVSLSNPALHAAAATYSPPQGQFVPSIPRSEPFDERVNSRQSEQFADSTQNQSATHQQQVQQQRAHQLNQPQPEQQQQTQPQPSTKTVSGIRSIQTQRLSMNQDPSNLNQTVCRAQTARRPSDSREASRNTSLRTPESARKHNPNAHVRFGEVLVRQIGPEKHVQFEQIVPSSNSVPVFTEQNSTQAVSSAPASQFNKSFVSAYDQGVQGGYQNQLNSPHVQGFGQVQYPPQSSFPGAIWYANTLATASPQQLLAQQFHPPTPFATHEDVEIDVSSTSSRRKPRLRPEDMILPAGVSSTSVPAVREREARYINESSDICAIHSSARSAVINYYART